MGKLLFSPLKYDSEREEYERLKEDNPSLDPIIEQIWDIAFCKLRILSRD